MSKNLLNIVVVSLAVVTLLASSQLASAVSVFSRDVFRELLEYRRLLRLKVVFFL